MTTATPTMAGAGSTVQVPTIRPAALAGRDLASMDLIDVRTPVEFSVVHAQGARSFPLDKLDCSAVLAGRKVPANTPVYLLCKSGKRATKAAEKFLAAGHANVLVIEGGTDAWLAAGLPVIRGKGVISLERQVRIAAGALVLVGVVLAFAVHWAFLGLSAFIGAGLVFAGVTDFCGMAMLLAKMPWNRSASCADRK